jgi:intermediate peptidase
MLGQTEFHNVSGTRCKLDFLEIPSTLMEYFLYDERIVQRFARHIHTGHPLPIELFRSIVAMKKIFFATEMQEQILYAAVDQAYHDRTTSWSKLDTSTIYHQLQRHYTLFDAVDDTAPQLSLTHLVHYGGCYYSYLYCRVISSHLWRFIFQKNPLNTDAGRLIRDRLLSPGGSRDPYVLLVDLLGKDFLNDVHFLELNLC